MSEADGEPDADAGDGAKDSGEEQKEFGVLDELLEPLGADLFVGHAHGLALGDGEIESAAHGKLRDHDVEDGDDANHPARAEMWNVPKWIVHVLAPSF